MKKSNLNFIIVIFSLFVMSCSDFSLSNDEDRILYSSNYIIPNSNSFINNIVIDGFQLNKSFTKDTFLYYSLIKYNTNSLFIYVEKEDKNDTIDFTINGNKINEGSSNSIYKQLLCYECTDIKDNNNVIIDVMRGDKKSTYQIDIEKEQFVKIATWNIENLSDSRSYEDITKISEIIAMYDVVAIQEVNSKTVLDWIKSKINHYDYIVTDNKVGTDGYAEYYAYFYNTNTTILNGIPYIYDDVSDDFVREPYIGYFKSKNFDFILATVHMVYDYGNLTSIRGEVGKLDGVLSKIEEDNPDEKDIILLGDFNLDCSDDGWEITTHTPLVSPDIKTTVRDVSSYDNIWINSTETLIQEFYSFDGIFKFDEIADYDGLNISDHRPVSAIYIINKDLD